MDMKTGDFMESSSLFGKLMALSLLTYVVIVGLLLVALAKPVLDLRGLLHQHLGTNETKVAMEIKEASTATVAVASQAMLAEQGSGFEFPILSFNVDDVQTLTSFSATRREELKQKMKLAQAHAETLQEALRSANGEVSPKSQVWRKFTKEFQGLNQLMEKVLKDLDRLREEQVVVANRQETVLMVVLAAFALVGALSIVLISRAFKIQVWSPVSQILRYTQRIEQGDLSVDPVDLAKTTGLDELGKIARAVYGLGKTIRSIFHAIQSHGADAGQIAANLDDHCRNLVELEAETGRSIDTLQQRFEDGLTMLEDFKAGAMSVQHDAFDLTGKFSDLALSSSQMIDNTKEMNNSLKSSSQSADGLMRNTDMVHAELSRVRDSIQETSHSAENLLKGILDSANQSAIIAGAVEENSATAEEIMAGNHQVMENIRVMDQNMESTFQQIEGLLQSIKTVDERIRESTSFSKEVTKTATEGSQIVDQAIEKMRQIKAMVQATAKQIKDLGSSTQEISNVVSTITNLAEQTNLLALNAAIEAARAGEEGKGFAVVADKVRNLAEQSSISAKNIEHHIHSVQNETEKVVQGMVEWGRQVEEGVSYADNAGKNMGTIVEKVRQADLLMHEIHQNTQDQAKKSDKVKQVVDKLATASQTIRISVQEQELGGRRMVDAIVTLRDIAHLLKNNSVEHEELGRAIFQTLQQQKDAADALNRKLTDHRQVCAIMQRNLQVAGRNGSEIHHLCRQQMEKHKDLQGSGEHLTEETRRLADRSQTELGRLQQLLEELRQVGKTSKKALVESKSVHADARVLTTTIQQLLDILVDFRLEEETTAAPSQETGLRALEV